MAESAGSKASTRSHAVLFVLAWVSLALSGCGGADEVDVSATRQTIVRGVASPTKHDGVVRVDTPFGFCSGTLVAPNLVLTARHCVTLGGKSGFICLIDGTLSPDGSEDAGVVGDTMDPSRVEVSVGRNLGDDQPITSAKQLFIHEGETICQDDLAIVELEDPLSAQPFPMRLFEATLPGEPLTVVGYGFNEVGVDRAERDTQVLRVGYSEDYFPYPGFSLDHTFVVGPGPCGGDSGGPALSEAGAVAGIYSINNFSDCQSELASGTYAQLAPLRDFILDVFDETGNEPLLAPETSGAGGEGGTASNEGSGGSSVSRGSGGNGAIGSGGDGGSGGDEGSESTGNGASGSGGGAGERSSTDGARGNAIGTGGGGCSCRIARPRAGAPLWALSLLGIVLFGARRLPHRERARRSRCWRSAMFLAAAGSVLALAPRALAQETAAARSAARDLGYQGVEAYQTGNYPLAFDKLDRAYALLKVPTLGLWSARALVKLGRLVEASERYLEVTRLKLEDDAPEVHRKAQVDASSERGALLERIPTLTVTISGAPVDEVELTLDEHEFPRAFVNTQAPVDPGQHVVVARFGERAETGRVEVAEAERATLELSFALPRERPPAAAPTLPLVKREVPPPVSDTPPPPEREAGSPTLAYVSLGVGAVGLATWGVTGYLALREKNDFEGCSKRTCDPEYGSQVKRYNGLRTASMVGFVVGAVGSVTGVTLLLASGDQGEPRRATSRAVPRTMLSIGAAGAVLTRSF